MEIDASIIQLGEKLDAWWDDFCPILDSEDRAAQGNALLPDIAIAKEFDRLKADGLAAIQALLDERNALSDEERATSLIRGFAFGARLADTLHDKLLDTDGEYQGLAVAGSNCLGFEQDRIRPRGAGGALRQP